MVAFQSHNLKVGGSIPPPATKFGRMEREENKSEYNDIPVHFCKDCLSLKIKRVEGTASFCYCDECGSTTIGSMQIDDWNRVYKERYGNLFINNKK